MKTAAEDATEILVHYLRHASNGRDLDDPDVFSEIEGVMQGLIDEAVKQAVADVLSRGVQRVLPPDWTYSPPVEPVLPPLGPMCVRPEPPLGPICVPPIAGVPQLLPGPSCLKQGEETEHLPSDRLSHVYNCKFCEQILMERGE